MAEQTQIIIKLTNERKIRETEEDGKNAIRANILWRREKLQVHMKCEAENEEEEKKRHATTPKTMRIEEEATAIAAPAREAHKI